MKPEILVLFPIYAPTLAELEREFTVHKLWTAKEPDALSVRPPGRTAKSAGRSCWRTCAPIFPGNPFLHRFPGTA